VLLLLVAKMFTFLEFCINKACNLDTFYHTSPFDLHKFCYVVTRHRINHDMALTILVVLTMLICEANWRRTYLKLEKWITNFIQESTRRPPCYKREQFIKT
jgi:hypothetical protein